MYFRKNFKNNTDLSNIGNMVYLICKNIFSNKMNKYEIRTQKKG